MQQQAESPLKLTNGSVCFMPRISNRMPGDQAGILVRGMNGQKIYCSNQDPSAVKVGMLKSYQETAGSGKPGPMGTLQRPRSHRPLNARLRYWNFTRRILESQSWKEMLMTTQPGLLSSCFSNSSKNSYQVFVFVQISL